MENEKDLTEKEKEEKKKKSFSKIPDKDIENSKNNLVTFDGENV